MTTKKILGAPESPDTLTLEPGVHVVAVAMESGSDPILVTQHSINRSVEERARAKGRAGGIHGSSWIVAPDMMQGPLAEVACDELLAKLAHLEEITPADLIQLDMGAQVMELGEAIGYGATTLVQPHCEKCGLMTSLVYAGILEHAAYRVVRAALTRYYEALAADREIDAALKVAP
jgi:hypothetical protein